MNIFLQTLKWMCGGLLLFTLAGCEASPTSESDINVTPASARLRVGEAMTFTASGWDRYSWALSNESMGTIDRHIGDSVVYTATSIGSSNQILTCTGIGSSSGATTTTVGTNVVVQSKNLTTDVFITQY